MMRRTMSRLLLGVGLSLMIQPDSHAAGEPDSPSPYGLWISVCIAEDGWAKTDSGYQYYHEIGRKGCGIWLYRGELSPVSNYGLSFDPTKKPMWLDVDAGRKKPDDVGGICRFDGELLIHCYGMAPNSKRPKDFVSTKTNRQAVVIYRPTAHIPENEPERLDTEVPLPGVDAPPYRPVYPYWRMLCRVENGEAVCPEGARVRMHGSEEDRGKNYDPKADNALSNGPLIYSRNVSWLDESRREGQSYLSRPGLCRREGDCLLWIVAKDWEPYDDRVFSPKRPTSFRPTKENGWILRVLYPPTEVFREAAEKHKGAG